MKAVILCGGQGTRLREETEYRPKPLVPVGGKPILWHIMKVFAHGGLRDFVLCLGYRGHMIKEYFLNYEAMTNDFTIALGEMRGIRYHNAHTEQDFRVTLVDTGQQSMTGGRIRRIRRYVEGETFMATYGDSLADIDVPRIVEFHRSHGRIATVSIVHPAWRFGRVEIKDSGEVVSFAEKPTANYWVSAGFFVFEPAVFDYLAGDSTALEQEPLERLAAEGQLMAYRHEGFFFAMDTYREYLALNAMWDAGDAPWKIWKDS
jgi:glucose-1-phosphate cytidylyltransferase